MSEAPALLEVENVTAGYTSGVDILHGVSAEVGHSEIVSIIGPNGAGKSTWLRVVTGLLKPRVGSVRLDGEDITSDKPHTRTLKGMGFVPQTDNVFPSLTVRENLEMGGYGMHDDEIAERVAIVESNFPVLSAKRSDRAGMLSGGQRQLLAMGRAMMRTPKVLCLDEPSAGLAPRAVTDIFRAVGEIADSGVSVLMVEQNARRALAISHRGYVLDMGSNAYTGRGTDLLHDDRVIQLYLGGGRAK